MREGVIKKFMTHSFFCCKCHEICIHERIFFKNTNFIQKDRRTSFWEYQATTRNLFVASNEIGCILQIFIIIVELLNFEIRHTLTLKFEE